MADQPQPNQPLNDQQLHDGLLEARSLLENILGRLTAAHWGGVQQRLKQAHLELHQAVLTVQSAGNVLRQEPRRAEEVHQ